MSFITIQYGIFKSIDLILGPRNIPYSDFIYLSIERITISSTTIMVP